MDEPILKCFYYTAFWATNYQSFIPFLSFLKKKHSCWCIIEEILIDKYPEKANIDHVLEIPCFVFYNKDKRFDSFTYIGSNEKNIEALFLNIRNLFYESCLDSSDATISPSSDSEDIKTIIITKT